MRFKSFHSIGSVREIVNAIYQHSVEKGKMLSGIRVENIKKSGGSYIYGDINLMDIPTEALMRAIKLKYPRTTQEVADVLNNHISLSSLEPPVKLLITNKLKSYMVDAIENNKISYRESLAKERDHVHHLRVKAGDVLLCMIELLGELDLVFQEKDITPASHPFIFQLMQRMYQMTDAKCVSQYTIDVMNSLEDTLDRIFRRKVKQRDTNI